MIATNPARRALAATTALVLALATLIGALAQGFGPAGPSPATGHSSIVASGIVSFEEGPSRWHVTRHTAQAGDDAVSSAQPGFIIAENTPILVILENDGTRYRLAQGEAMAIPATSPSAPRPSARRIASSSCRSCRRTAPSSRTAPTVS